MEEQCQKVKENDYSPVRGACEAACAVLCPLLSPSVQDRGTYCREPTGGMIREWKLDTQGLSEGAGLHSQQEKMLMENLIPLLHFQY